MSVTSNITASALEAPPLFGSLVTITRYRVLYHVVWQGERETRTFPTPRWPGKLLVLERPMSTGKRRYFRSRLSRSSGIASLEKDSSPTFSQMFLAKTYMCLLGILTFGWRQTNVNRNIPLCHYV